MRRVTYIVTLLAALAPGLAHASPVNSETWWREHVGYGSQLAGGVYAAARPTVGQWGAVGLGLSATLAVGAAKEFRDAAATGDGPRKGLADFGADCLGAVAGVGLTLGVHWAVERFSHRR